MRLGGNDVVCEYHLEEQEITLDIYNFIHAIYDYALSSCSRGIPSSAPLILFKSPL